MTRAIRTGAGVALSAIIIGAWQLVELATVPASARVAAARQRCAVATALARCEPAAAKRPICREQLGPALRAVVDGDSVWVESEDGQRSFASIEFECARAAE